MFIMTMPDRYSVAGLVKAYRLMREKAADDQFRWVPQSEEWLDNRYTASQWFQWFQNCLTEKINRCYQYRGKGNRAARRIKQMEDARATCKWCGNNTRDRRWEFCDDHCRESYYS